MVWCTAAKRCSPVDVATEHQVSPPAVRKAKSRVLRRLKQELGDLIEGMKNAVG
jgi:RNA polymerase sigma-70 factor (ECF subfamily)